MDTNLTGYQDKHRRVRHPCKVWHLTALCSYWAHWFQVSCCH